MRKTILAVLVLAVLALAACATANIPPNAMPGGEAPQVLSLDQVRVANDYLGQSLTNMTAGYQALLADEQAKDPARAAQIKAKGDGLLSDLQLATLGYQAATSSSAQIRADNPQVNSAWLTALDAVSRVASVVGPFALEAIAGK